MDRSWPAFADELAPTTVMLLGFVLLVIPEPATSAFGTGLLLFGAAWWVYEWRRP